GRGSRLLYRCEAEPTTVVAPVEDRPPPPFVAEIPTDRLRQPLVERARGLPAELAADQRCVDRIAQVVSGTIGDETNEALPRPVRLRAQRVVQEVANPLHDLEVATLRTAAHGIRLPDLAALEHANDRSRVVLDEEPIPDVLAFAVHG